MGVDDHSQLQGDGGVSGYGTRLPSLTPGLSRMDEPEEGEEEDDDDQVDAELLKYWEAVAGDQGGDASALFGRPGEEKPKKRTKKGAGLKGQVNFPTPQCIYPGCPKHIYGASEWDITGFLSGMISGQDGGGRASGVHDL